MERTHLTKSHGDHDPSWSFQGGVDSPPSCLACLVEIIENGKNPNIKKKKVLAELLAYLHASKEKADLLTSDLRVTTHVVLLLIDLLKSKDRSVQEIATLCAVQILCLVKSEEVLCCTMDTISLQTLKVCNLVQSIPVFSLLGQMLDAIPQLASQLLRCYGSLVDYMASGLSYPDDNLQASLCYLWRHLYSPDNDSMVSGVLSRKVSKALTQILAASNSDVLQLNALGTIKVMLYSPEQVELLVCPQADNRGIIGGLKRALVAKHEMVPVASVQCISAVLEVPERGQHYAELFLQEDTAEFLFDALTIANELLLSSVWCCLMKLADCEVFYAKYHAVYGMESIIRGAELALEIRNPHIITLAMSVLAKVLQRHDGNVRLLSQESLLMRCLQLMEQGCAHPHHNVFLQSSKTLLQLIRKHHLHCPVPFMKIWENIALVLRRLNEGGRMHTVPASVSGPDRGGQTGSRALKSLMIQKTIVLTAALLHQAARLVTDCKLDPASDASRFTKPDGNEVTQTEIFCQRLVSALDETCIPLLMANCKYLQDDAAYLHVCGSINTLLQTYQPLTVQLLQKMTATGVISALMGMKTHFRPETMNEVNVLVTNLCLSSLDSEDLPTGFASTLHTALSQLKGGGSEICQVLKQKWVECDDHNLRNTQHVALLLIYTVMIQGDCLAPMDQVLDAVLCYLVNHHDMLSEQPHVVTRALVYIVAATTVTIAKKSENEWHHAAGEWALLKYLHNEAHVDDWACLELPVLQWVFVTPQIMNALAKSVVQFWIKQEKGLESIKTLMKQNCSCLRVTLSVLSTGKAADGCHLLSETISQILSNSDQEDIAIHKKQLEVITDMLPAVIIQQLLSLDPSIKGENLAVMFTLLTKIKIQTAQDRLVERDFKLAFHVCRYMADLGDNSSDAQWAGCNLITCLLIQSFNESDTRVAAIILSNAQLLAQLQVFLDGVKSPHPVAVLLSFLCVQQSIHGLEVQRTVKIPMKATIQGLISSNTHLVLCCLHLLIAVFSTRGQSKLLHCHLGSCREELYTSDDLVLPFTSKQLCLVLFHLQQCLLKDAPCVQELAVNCLRSLLCLVEPCANLYKHMLDQPWTKIILRAALTVHGNDCLPSWVIRLTSLLLQGKSRYINPSLAERMADEFSNKSPDASWPYLRLSETAELIYERNMLQAKPEKTKDLENKLNEAKALFKELPEFQSKPRININLVDDLVCGIVL